MLKLFSPAKLGSLELKNHIVMAPMTRSRALLAVPNELMAEYYAQRAAAGLIITEGASPSPNGLGYARIPGIFNDDQIKGWKKTTEAVRERGGKIFLQLMHTGRIGHPSNLPAGAVMLAPSAVKLETKIWTDGDGELDMPIAREMTKEELLHTQEEYVQASRNAIEAGFHGVELHGANGYLLEQFIHPATNKRTDEYGGSIEKRSLFVIETIKKIADAIGKDKVGVRLSPYGIFNEMPNYPECEATYNYLTKELNKLDVVYVHLVDHSSMGAPDVPPSIVRDVRKHFKNTLILSGGFDAERAEAVLQNKEGDLIAFGKSFLSNPDLVRRMINRFPLNTPRFELFYTPGPEGYTDYPVFEKMKVL